MSTKTKTYYEELGRKLSIHFPDIEMVIGLDPEMRKKPLMDDIKLVPAIFQYFLENVGVYCLDEIEDLGDFKVTVILAIIKAYDPELLITDKIIKRGLRKAVANLFQDHPSTISQLISKWREYPQIREQYQNSINTYSHDLARDLGEIKKTFYTKNSKS